MVPQGHAGCSEEVRRAQTSRATEGKRRTIGEEITRLLAAGFIMEVFHPDWLANPVLVLKKNNT